MVPNNVYISLIIRKVCIKLHMIDQDISIEIKLTNKINWLILLILNGESR